MKSIIFYLEFLWLLEIIHCFLCGKTNFRFYCLENLHNTGKTFSPSVSLKSVNHAKSFFQAGLKSLSFFAFFTLVGKGITSMSVFFTFPFFIFPATFEIA